MILTYHHIGEGNDENCVSVQSFARQMSELQGKRVVHLEDYDENDPAHAAITFDDGSADIKNALPILQKYGYPFSVGIVGDWFGTDGYIGESDVAAILAAGGRLQWHTKTHRKLTELSDAELEIELFVPPAIRKLDPDGFNALIYPYWIYDAHVLEAVRQKFSIARSGNGFAGEGGIFAIDSVKANEDTHIADKIKIKRFLDCYLPITACNLKCHYCYITQQGNFNYNPPVFKYSPRQIGKALSKERLGGTCCLNICGGGETLIPPEITEIIRCILEQGHYLMIVTNGTVGQRLIEILSLPSELLSRLFFKFSFHYIELKKHGFIDFFFDNVKMTKKAGCSFSIELTPNDETIPYIDDIKKLCLSNAGALCHVTIARDDTQKGTPILTQYEREKYKEIWSQFDSELFRYKLSVFNEKRTEFCYAGDWVSYLNLGTGDLTQCYRGKILQNIFENPNEPIKFCAIGNNCPESHCYNAHAWLTFGAIPEHKSPAYADMRNRICSDSSQWLTPHFKEFMNSKLADMNIEYTLKEKEAANKFSGIIHEKTPAMITPDNNKNVTKRVAIQFFGHLRTFRDTFENFRRFVLKPQLDTGYEADVFIHTWDVLEQKAESLPPWNTNKRLAEVKVPDADINFINENYHPKSFVIEHQTENKRQNYSILAVNGLREKHAQENGVTYDWVITTRPDILFFTPLVIDSYLKTYFESELINFDLPYDSFFVGNNIFGRMKVADPNHVAEWSLVWFFKPNPPKSYAGKGLMIPIDYRLNKDFIIKRADDYKPEQTNINRVKKILKNSEPCKKLKTRFRIERELLKLLPYFLVKNRIKKLENMSNNY